MQGVNSEVSQSKHLQNKNSLKNKTKAQLPSAHHVKMCTRINSVERHLRVMPDNAFSKQKNNASLHGAYSITDTQCSSPRTTHRPEQPAERENEREREKERGGGKGL